MKELLMICFISKNGFVFFYSVNFNKMVLFNATSAMLDAVFYNNGIFVDLRSVDKATAQFLKTALNYEIQTGEFDGMTIVSNVSIENRFGSVDFDADNNDHLRRFLDFWVFPCSRKLVEHWTVVLSMTKKTVYDNDGNVVADESW
jgi:hypothetical protein